MPRPIVIPSSDESSDEEGVDNSPYRGNRAELSNFLDIEADESQSSDDDDDDDDDDSNDEDDDDEDDTPQSFTSFMNLPAELRLRIWELYCPDLVAPLRVLQFDLRDCSAATRVAGGWNTHTDVYAVRDALTLADQTECQRRVMAVHRESRALALHRFPDTLLLDDVEPRNSLLSFSKERDIVMIDNLDIIDDADRYSFHVSPGFADNVLHLALRGCLSSADIDPDVQNGRGLDFFPNLRRLYRFFEPEHPPLSPRDLAWVTSDYAHRYVIRTYEKEYGIGEDQTIIVCVPDVDRHPDFAKHQLPQVFAEDPSPEVVAKLQSRGIESWPMIVFDGNWGMRRYDKLRRFKYEAVADIESDLFDSSSESGHDYGGDSAFHHLMLDEYESEGIDDSFIEQYDDLDRDDLEDDLLDPWDYQDGYVNGSWDPHTSRAGFPFSDISSSESSSAENFNPQPESRPVETSRTLKRKIVVSSDSESGSDEPSAKQRPAKRMRLLRVAVVDSDDDSSESSTQATKKCKTRNRARAVIDSDSESDSDDDSGGVAIGRAPRNGRASSSSGSSSTTDHESPEDDSVRPLRQSLAERLQAERLANPIPSSDGEDNSSENEEGDSDEDEGDEDDDEEEHELLDGMAAESDGEGDEGESDSEGCW
ncbi:hypothetical protein HIM_07873 [Hirsutella minnesotensis 3608]|uniref:2EXR domain-containing protein n=1 Tax=Hirsutella minnesotensis 3608 TaxID=1043627 RepID=A0A0F7ZHI1_9HYPO|nr:hypothetical protein HIM_07873 [Hirsutella minnesotensis 3608]